LDIRDYNREAWNKQVQKGNLWTIPSSPEAIAAAHRGEWRIDLTPTKAVPHEWLPDLPGKKVLCLASGGGQQGPILAAAGAIVTVLDNSPAQLERDRFVAERENLHITTVEGDMRDLHMFADGSFDYIVHPISNIFIPDLKQLWQEAFRVLRPGGVMISGISNPILYIFDWEMIEKHHKLEVKHKLPYSDLESLTDSQKAQYIANGDPFEFSHTLEEQIGGQINAGFLIAGFYEDKDNIHSVDSPLNDYIDPYFATRAIKPQD
jgi:SAM-dependent methyltransferase